MDLNIQHDTAHHRFYVLIDGKEALLDYSQSGNILDYYHTFVPPELRGQQIAEKIVLFALDYAKKNNYKVIPSCPYVARLLERHSEFNSIIV